MFKNYFKIAFRNLWRHKVYSLINISGLAIGMAACFLIYLYVSFELSYDRFNTKADRIYRLVTDVHTPTETLHPPITSAPMAINIARDFPEVEQAVRIAPFRGIPVYRDNQRFEEATFLADSTIFKVFDFPLVQGDPDKVLTAPFSIVLSQTAAKKYFGDANPIGQTLLLLDDKKPAKVTGVMKDIPQNAQFRTEFFLSMASMKDFNPNADEQWGSFGTTAYLLLKPGTSAAALEARLPAFLDSHIGQEMKDSKMSYTLFLEPLKDVYLKSTRGGFVSGSINNVYIFSVIGIFILLIACINFINLTTARSVERAKEVGIRKVVGAMRMQLTGQFLGESVLICLFAFVLSVACSALLLPLFNQLANKTVATGIFSQPLKIAALFLTAVIIGLLAGFYPAAILSSFKPIRVLKGRFSSGSAGLLLRKALVITQFTISIALIVGTLVVYRQLNFMENYDLGFQKEQMVLLNAPRLPKQAAFQQAINQVPGVEATSFSSAPPGGGTAGAYSQIENSQGDMQIANLDLLFTDFDYIPVYKMKMVAGRAFSHDFPTDSTQAMILNETAVKQFGYTSPKDIIGKRFSQWGREGQIIGVVRDFHFKALQEPIQPLSIRIEKDQLGMLTARVQPGNIKTTLARMEAISKQMQPDRPFEYHFLDEFFNRQYESETQFGNLFLNFAIFAIFISCLGLLGLASYTTLQRTREIGIRKVMGASAGNIINLLSIDFLKLVLIAFVIATPIAWLAMHSWLKDFAYRITPAWWLFATAGLLALLIAFATISFQAFRAALSNPVKSLRTE